jgi:anhydro-N-acetylmuramic acid kinase
LQRVVALNAVIGERFAEAAARVVQLAGLQMSDIDAIASHGQTVWHQPQPISIGKREGRGTLQLGDPAIIAARTGALVVSGFRAADMALGGQGAPLAPFADYALFASQDETRAVQNIGGIGNVAYFPAGGGPEQVIAFDTGPGNMVIDAIMTRLSGGSMTYDLGGAMASRGQVCEVLLAWAMAHPYFEAPPPKSTGREEFGAIFVDRFVAEADRLGCREADLVATATALTAESIAQAYRRWLIPVAGLDVVIVCGGGAYNPTLCRMLAERLSPVRVETCAKYGMPPDAKEAALFALLGYETLHGRPCTLPCATGASAAAVSGSVTFPPGGRIKYRIPLDTW